MIKAKKKKELKKQRNKHEVENEGERFRGKTGMLCFEIVRENVLELKRER